MRREQTITGAVQENAKMSGENVESAIRPLRDAGIFIDQFPGLIVIKKKVTDFTDAILILHVKGYDRKKPVFEFISAAAAAVIHVISPGQIQIPGMD